VRRPPARNAGPLHAEAALLELAERSARRLAAALDRQWALHTEIARTLQRVTADTSRQDIRALLDSAQHGAFHLTWMGVAEARTGRVLAATGGIIEGANVGSRPWFSAGLRGHFAGDVHAAVLLQRALRHGDETEPLRLIDFATPLHDGAGAVAAVLGAHLDWEWIRRLVREEVVPIGAAVALVSQAGAVLFGPDVAYAADLAAMPRAEVAQAPGAPSFGWSIVAMNAS
jgi:drug/metabolite transporter superfamily protein YnfA